ncbi:MAG: hypothetical protein VXY77_04845 [Pseudomonadota bacterium]|nr:hypothetical protein [Pseudomonadota bacterium]
MLSTSYHVNRYTGFEKFALNLLVAFSMMILYSVLHEWFQDQFMGHHLIVVLMVAQLFIMIDGVDQISYWVYFVFCVYAECLHFDIFGLLPLFVMVYRYLIFTCLHSTMLWASLILMVVYAKFMLCIFSVYAVVPKVLLSVVS